MVEFDSNNVVDQSEVVDWSKFEVLIKKKFFSVFRQKVICFIHGFTSSFSSHDKVFQLFVKKGYKLFAFNLPAHGKSKFEFKQNDLTLVNFANLVVKFIQFHKLNDVILVGHSMGGAIATIVFSLIPQKIKCLVLEGPLNKGAFNPKGIIKSVFQKNFAGKYSILHPIETFRYSYKNNPDYKKILQNMFSSETTKLISNAYEKIGDCPTLLIFGEDDRVINPKFSIRYIQTCASNLTVKIIPNAGHSPAYEQPELYFEIVQKFIQELYFSLKQKRKKWFMRNRAKK